MSTDKEQVAQTQKSTGTKEKERAIETQKDLVIQLRDLARHPNHQAALMDNEACLTSLQQYLRCEDVDIVLITIEILHICAQTPRNRPKLVAVNNLIDMLDVHSTGHQDPKVRKKASELLHELCPEDEDVSDNLEEVETASRISQASQNSRYITKQLYMVHLRIGNVRSSAQRDKFFIDAVKHERVVSATMDSQLRNAILYTTQPNIKDELIKHLTRKGYEILSKDFGFRYSERVKPLMEVSEKEDMSEEDDIKIGGPAYLAKDTVDARLRDDSYALGRYRPNIETETLTSRLDRFKQEQEESKEKEASVLSTIVKWFW